MSYRRRNSIQVSLLITLLLLAGLILAPTAGAVPPYDCDLVTEIPRVECEALVELYKRTDGDNWLNNEGWLHCVLPSMWSGVTVFGGHVIAIDLRGNGLSGTLPAELSELTYLSSLQLYGNHDLVGALPLEWASLVHLEDLRYDDTGLCDPADPSFQAWLQGISHRVGANLPCEPAATATITPQATIPQPTPRPTLAQRRLYLPLVWFY